MITIKEKLIPKSDKVIEEPFLIDKDSLMYISTHMDSKIISDIILKEVGKNAVIFDLTAGVGGNVISFAQNFKYVIACEINKIRAEYCKKNCESYGLDNVAVSQCDSIKYINSLRQISSDVVFFDPPWGGYQYRFEEAVNLYLGDLTVEEVCLLVKKKRDDIIVVIKLPLNYDWKYLDKELKRSFSIKITKINKIAVVVLRKKD